MPPRDPLVLGRAGTGSCSDSQNLSDNEALASINGADMVRIPFSAKQKKMDDWETLVERQQQYNNEWAQGCQAKRNGGRLHQWEPRNVSYCVHATVASLHQNDVFQKLYDMIESTKEENGKPTYSITVEDKDPNVLWLEKAPNGMFRWLAMLSMAFV